MCCKLAANEFSILLFGGSFMDDVEQCLIFVAARCFIPQSTRLLMPNDKLIVTPKKAIIEETFPYFYDEVLCLFV